MLMRALLVLALFPLQDPPGLTGDSFEKWRDHIRPSGSEMKWTRIPWRATFWDGVVEAQKKDMPILLWAMNGHPLACV